MRKPSPDVYEEVILRGIDRMQRIINCLPDDLRRDIVLTRGEYGDEEPRCLYVYLDEKQGWMIRVEAGDLPVVSILDDQTIPAVVSANLCYMARFSGGYMEPDDFDWQVDVSCRHLHTALEAYLTRGIRDALGVAEMAADYAEIKEVCHG